MKFRHDFSSAGHRPGCKTRESSLCQVFFRVCSSRLPIDEFQVWFISSVSAFASPHTRLLLVLLGQQHVGRTQPRDTGCSGGLAIRRPGARPAPSPLDGGGPAGLAHDQQPQGPHAQPLSAPLHHHRWTQPWRAHSTSTMASRETSPAAASTSAC